MSTALHAIYPWALLAHLTSVFGFLLAHGVSAGVLFKLRGEHKRERIRALLDLSKRSIVWTYAFLVLIGVTGFTTAYLGNRWRQVWIWASAALLILISLAMNWIGDGYYDQLRIAVGVEEPEGNKGRPAPLGPLPETPAGEEKLRQLLRSPRPWFLALIGSVGLAAILGLMVFQPTFDGWPF
jgi:hypothetical protein